MKGGLLIELRKILSKDALLEEYELQKTAYELLSRQFLFRAKKHQRRNYTLVSKYQDYFHKLMKATNHQLVVDETRGYVGIIPINYTRKLTLEETLLMLAARNIYEDEVNSFHANDDGSIDIPVSDFEIKYQSMTGRNLPVNKKDFLAIIKPLTRCGVLNEYNSAEEGIWLLHINPTITTLISGDTTKLLEAHMRASNITIDDQDDS